MRRILTKLGIIKYKKLNKLKLIYATIITSILSISIINLISNIFNIKILNYFTNWKDNTNEYMQSLINQTVDWHNDNTINNLKKEVIEKKETIDKLNTTLKENDKLIRKIKNKLESINNNRGNNGLDYEDMTRFDIFLSTLITGVIISIFVKHFFNNMWNNFIGKITNNVVVKSAVGKLKHLKINGKPILAQDKEGLIKENIERLNLEKNELIEKKLKIEKDLKDIINYKPIEVKFNNIINNSITYINEAAIINIIKEKEKFKILEKTLNSFKIKIITQNKVINNIIEKQLYDTILMNQEIWRYKEILKNESVEITKKSTENIQKLKEIRQNIENQTIQIIDSTDIILKEHHNKIQELTENKIKEKNNNIDIIITDIVDIFEQEQPLGGKNEMAEIDI